MCAQKATQMRVVLFVLGLLPASGGFQLLADRGLQRVGSAIEGANRALDNQEEKQVAFAKSISDFISRTRQSVFDSNPFRAMGEFPLAPPEYFLVDDVAALRNSLRMILQEERIIGLFLLGTCTLLAVVGGTTAGQHSSLPGRAQKDDQDLAFRKTLSSEAAAAFDAGRSPQAVETLQTRSELLRRAGNRGDRDVTVIMWLVSRFASCSMQRATHPFSIRLARSGTCRSPCSALSWSSCCSAGLRSPLSPFGKNCCPSPISCPQLRWGGSLS